MHESHIVFWTMRKVKFESRISYMVAAHIASSGIVFSLIIYVDVELKTT